MNLKQTETDVLIVGSGPIGATYARMINDALPNIKITMIDVGPRLTDEAGIHVKNIADEKQQENAQIKSQGSYTKAYPLVTVAERANAANAGQLNLDVLARPGTHLVSTTMEDLKKNEMPALHIQPMWVAWAHTGLVHAQDRAMMKRFHLFLKMNMNMHSVKQKNYYVLPKSLCRMCRRRSHSKFVGQCYE